LKTKVKDKIKVKIKAKDEKVKKLEKVEIGD
jgi:hypothetical protein